MSWQRILQRGVFYRPQLTIQGDNRPMLGFYVPLEARNQPAPVNGREMLEHLGWGVHTGKPCDTASGACACGQWHQEAPPAAAEGHTANADCKACGAADTRSGLDEAGVIAFGLAWKLAHRGCFKKPPKVTITGKLGAKR